MSIIICISGERYTSYFKEKIEYLLKEYHANYDDIKCIFGDCSGVDSDALEICKKLNITYEIYKSEWAKYGKSAGPKRNKQMVNLLDKNKDVLLAFHRDIESSKGTLNTINLAKKKGVKVFLYSS